MSVELELAQTLAKMPDNLKQEVLHYAQYLMASHLLPATVTLSALEAEQATLSVPSTEEPEKYRQAGSLEGKIIMSDDFDKPLEELKEYM